MGGTMNSVFGKTILLGGAAAGCAAVGACSDKTGQNRPNVIIVMTDDQGYAEFSCNGNPIVKTPNLDAFASDAVRLTDFHSAPMSTATRGQLLTGLNAVENCASNVSSGRAILRPDVPTMPEIFAEAGYETALFGKWHLGDEYPYRPEDRGFGTTMWFPSSHIGSVPDFWGNDCFDDVYIHNGRRERMNGYCTDVFFDGAMEWMDSRVDEGKPFLLCLFPNAPHGPFNAPQNRIDSLAARVAATEIIGMTDSRKKDLARYLAMIECLDDRMGDLVNYVRKKGIEDNTVFVFLTDNGCLFNPYYASYPQRGKKAQLYEGGHRVPCWISYPGNLASNLDIGGLTQVQDILPTLAELCHIDTDAHFDGISLAGVLREEDQVPDRMLCINFSRMPTAFNYPSPHGSATVRRGETAVLWRRWRLLPGDELYNLDTDPLQRKNVRDSFPEIFSRLQNERDRWWNDVKDVSALTLPLVVGAPGRDSTLLTACDWMNVFVDQQAQVRKGTRRNSYWMLDVRRSGRYLLELRRYPRESELSLDSAPDGCNHFDIARAGIFIGLEDETVNKRSPVSKDDECACFEVTLPEGPAALHTWFLDADNEALFGAYYVYVTYLGE